MNPRRSRPRALARKLIAISISYQRDNLLARGLGLEHLRELLLRLVRQPVRQGASLAYGGHWKETDDNFTFDLLRLIGAEQLDGENPDDGPGAAPAAPLLHHSAWPDYLEITPAIEAQWINSCRIVRVSQQDAGIAPGEWMRDAEGKSGSDRALWNAAVTVSAMRRLVMTGMPIPIPDADSETVPPAVARVVLGGKVSDYRGFLPGIFEEVLLTLEHQRPLYVLGGFGGAAEVIAKALIGAGPGRPAEFTVEWHREKTPGVAKLLDLAATQALPPGVRATSVALDALFAQVEQARADLPGALRTGLDLAETRELLTTRDISRAVQLVRQGLENTLDLQMLPA